MRPLVQVQPGPQERPRLTETLVTAVSVPAQPMDPVWDQVLRALPLVSQYNASEQTLCDFPQSWFCVRCRTPGGLMLAAAIWDLAAPPIGGNRTLGCGVLTREGRLGAAMAEAQQAATFEELYRAVFGRLVGQLALVTGSLPEAEDLGQGGFLRAGGRR